MAERYTDYNPDMSEYFDDEELDSIRSTLAYILMSNTELDKDMIYDLVFHEGDAIIWH